MSTAYLLFGDASADDSVEELAVDSPVIFDVGDKLTIEGKREYEVKEVFWWVRTLPGSPGYKAVCQHVLLT